LIDRVLRRNDARAAPLVLALDWTGAAQDALIVGRGPGCHIAFHDETVSRRHAQLTFRDGWLIQDLQSMNGTTVNGERVGRCRVRPGDRLGLGAQLVDID
jgi:pSer/pThr/pTyr-binding forkhead associated (FHA) protein